MAGTGASSGLANYLEELRKRNVRKQRKKRAENSLKEMRTPYGMTRQNEMGVVSENGLNKRDARMYREDRSGYRNEANDLVMRNTMEDWRRGIKMRDYPQERALKRMKEKKNGR